LGTIVDQYPKPNTRVKSGRTVRLKIAQPEKSVAIPNLIGQSRRSAELELNQMGLLIDTVYTEYNPEYPNGTIAWQYPKAGDRRKKGMGIQITVSKGMPPNFFQVPNLIGLSINQAKDLIFKSRLKVGKISYHQDQDLVPYTVLDQSIKNGTVLDATATINLVVSVLDIQDIFNNLNNEP
jgi:serine/threonine-protein kinase